MSPADAVPTRARLAETLAGIHGIPATMIAGAAGGYYDDYLSPLAFPLVKLVTDLREISSAPTTGPEAKQAIAELIVRVVDGEFDGTREEARAWAASAEGRQVFKDMLGRNS